MWFFHTFSIKIMSIHRHWFTPESKRVVVLDELLIRRNVKLISRVDIYFILKKKKILYWLLENACYVKKNYEKKQQLYANIKNLIWSILWPFRLFVFSDDVREAGGSDRCRSQRSDRHQVLSGRRNHPCLFWEDWPHW